MPSINRSVSVSSRRRTLRPLIAVVLVISVIAPLIAVPRAARAASAVTTATLNLRSGPSFQQRVRAVMPEGSVVEITGGPRHGFYRVSYNGTAGWALADYLDLSGASVTGGEGGGNGSATVLSGLNLRAGPSTGDAVLTVMPAGATVTLTGGSTNGFLAVDYRGTSGWAYAALLDTSGGAPDAGPAAVSTSGSAGSATVSTSLNLRDGPSTANRVITVMPAGATVDLTGDSANGFLGVVYNGTSGWAHAGYLNSGGGSSPSSSGSTGNTIIDIIYAAADRYGQSREDMLRVAQCESGLDPNNVTPPYDASGLFQFLPGTWASTPYANYSVFDPWANANATGWMWSVGRRNEWVCQ